MGSDTTDAANPFVGWLLKELVGRQWTREDLAREAGITSSAISNIVNRNKPMGVDVAKRIAAALEVSQVTIFRMAGLLDDDEEAVNELKEHESARQISELLARYPPEERERFLKIFHSILAAESPSAEDELAARARNKPARTARTS